MQFMMTICVPAPEFAKRDDPEAAGPQRGAWTEYARAINADAVVLEGRGLMPPHAATALRLADGRHVVEDGPFLDTKKQLGGYFLLEVADLDAALDWAARRPAAPTGRIELRPVPPPAGVWSSLRAVAAR